MIFFICGDFNLVLDPILDLDNYRNVNNPKSREKLIEIMDDLNIIDYYRTLHSNERRYTWRRTHPKKTKRGKTSS